MGKKRRTLHGEETYYPVADCYNNDPVFCGVRTGFAKPIRWEHSGANFYTNESFVQRVESCNGFLALEHEEEIGMGTRAYELVNLD